MEVCSTNSSPSGASRLIFRPRSPRRPRLQDLLAHLYVLIPVLDNEKHYWVGEDEIQKLLNRGEGWLAQHPEKDLIVSRYLKRQRHLTPRGAGEVV